MWRLIKPATGPLDKRRPALYQAIADRFSHEEIGELAYLVGVEPDHLFGENDTARQKALSLELWAAKHEVKGRLVEKLGELRPTVDWDGYG